MKQFSCVCGKCDRDPVDTCTCEFASAMRRKIKGLLMARKLDTDTDREQAFSAVRRALVGEYGKAVVAEDRDIRPVFLRWFPIVLFAGGALLLGLLARRSLVRRRTARAAGPP
jgi:hypothetical protein